MYRRRFAFAFVVVLVALLCGACSGGGTPTPGITSSIVAPTPTQPTEPERSWVKINSVQPSSSSVVHYGDTVMAEVSWSLSDQDWANVIKETGQGKVYFHLCPAPDEDHVTVFCPGIGVFEKSGTRLVDGVPLRNQPPGNTVRRVGFARVFVVSKLSTLFPTNIEDVNLMLNYPVSQAKYISTDGVPWETIWVAP